MKRTKLVSIAMCAFLAASAADSRAQDASWVETATATAGRLSPTITVTGSLASVWQADLAGMVGGRLQRLHVEPGDRLASGSPAWEIDPADARLALDAAMAAAEVAQRQYDELKAGPRSEEIDRLEAVKSEAEAFLAQVQADKKRLTRLQQDDALPPARYDEIIARERMAQSQLRATMAGLGAARRGATPQQIAVAAALVAQAQVGVQQARKRLTDTIVRAPRDARVTMRFKNAGDMVAPGEPVLRLVSIDPIEVGFHLGESQLEYFTKGVPVTVRLSHDPTVLPATMTRMIPLCDEASRRVPVKAELENSDGKLLPGLSAAITINKKPVDASLIPDSALVSTSAGVSVYLVQNDRVRLVPVRELGRQNGSVAVDGIASGATVVTRGAMGLRDGAIVRVRQ